MSNTTRTSFSHADDVIEEKSDLGIICGETTELPKSLGEDTASFFAMDRCARFREISTWLDAWLINAVTKDPPDEIALEVLIIRYSGFVSARCRDLTFNSHKANDLAQETWCRVLRARRCLRADGNFRAFLSTIATNLYRDAYRSSCRAGLLAENQMIPLNAIVGTDNENVVALEKILAENNLDLPGERTQVKMDINLALRQLPPLLQNVLVARFFQGESCAEIGKKYQRTEQTISSWVRKGVSLMRLHLLEAGESSKDVFEEP